MARQIDVVIDADARGFARGTQQAADSLDRFHKSALVAAAGAAAAFAAVNIGSFAKDSLLAASDLNETMSKTSVVFGDAAGWVQEWSKGTATALGQTRTQALDAAATFGVFGKSAGLTGDALGSFSTDMTVLASDMASFSNTSVDQAIEAIGAAMRGESEPIRAYGVLLDDATLKARAMKLGIYDGNGALTQQQRVLAAQAEILAQTSDAQGDFARTQGGMANQMRIFSAQWGTLKTTVGEAMLPLATSIMPQLNRAVEAGAAKLAEYMPQIKAGAESAAKFVGDLLAGFKANGPDGEQAMASLKIAAGELGDLAKSAAEKAAALTRWFTEMSPEAQKATLAIGGTVAALLLLNGTAKANPVTRIGVELTGTVMKATAEGAIGLLFRSLANRISAMTVNAAVVHMNAKSVIGGGGVDTPGGVGGTGTGGGRVASTLKALGAITVIGTTATLMYDVMKTQMQNNPQTREYYQNNPTGGGAGNPPIDQAGDMYAERRAELERQATEETIRNTEAQREAAAATRAREAAMAPLAAITALQTNAVAAFTRATDEQKAAIFGSGLAAQQAVAAHQALDGTTVTLAESQRQQAQAFIASTVQMGVSKETAVGLAVQYGLIPKEVATLFLAQTEQASEARQRLGDEYGLTPEEVETLFIAATQGAADDWNALADRYGLTPTERQTIFKALTGQAGVDVDDLQAKILGVPREVLVNFKTQLSGAWLDPNGSGSFGSMPFSAPDTPAGEPIGQLQPRAQTSVAVYVDGVRTPARVAPDPLMSPALAGVL
jgi:hypothetical protein